MYGTIEVRSNTNTTNKGVGEMNESLIESAKMEFETNGNSPRYSGLTILQMIVNEADDQENERIYYKTSGGKKQIVLCEVPDLSNKYGTDYNIEGVQSKLRGLAENYKNFDGSYLVSVVTTHDLNHAIINDINEMMFEIRG